MPVEKQSQKTVTHCTPEQARKILGDEDFELFSKLGNIKDKIKAITRKKPTKKLLAQWNRLNAAKNTVIGRLLERHHTLAYYFARLWIKQRPAFRERVAKKMEDSDLCSAAIQGLCTAIEHFDMLHGNRFASYAHFWMSNTMRTAIAQAYGIRVSTFSRIAELHQAKHALADQLKREPSEREVCHHLKIMPLILERLRRSEASTLTCRSLDDVAFNDSDNPTALSNLVADAKAPTTDNEYQKIALALAMNQANLNKREHMVIEILYGLKDGQRRTLRAAGALLQLSRERVRQIESKALQKLRRPAIQKSLLENL